jgi:choice-of-anchor A domain-containing protein
VKTPSGVLPSDLALGSDLGALRQENGVHLIKDSGGYSSLASVEATARLFIGTDGQDQSAYSELLGLDVGDRTHLHGVVKTASTYTHGASVLVDGGVTQNTSLRPLASLSWNVAFPSLNRGSCLVQPDNTETIDPGTYGDITVYSRSHLKLRTGTYYFKSLSIDSGAFLDVDNAAGPVFVNVRNAFGWNGTVAETQPTKGNIVFALATASAVNIYTAFRGIIVAPSASLTLASDGTSGHFGAFFAKSLTAQANAIIHQRPLSNAAVCPGATDCNALCPCSGGGLCQVDSDCQSGFKCQVPSGGGAKVCTAINPDDGNPCTADSIVNGNIVHTPLPAGTSCSDGNVCNGAETCNASAVCVAGTPPVLSDGNPCTTDACTASTGVTHAPVPVGTQCSDGNACNGMETCNASAACVAGTPPVTDDGNPCTFDSCDPTAGVTHVARRAGSSCSDGNLCNGAETCNDTGTCVPGAPLVVADTNPCTIDSCNASGGVSHTPAPSGTPCPDSNACNGAEVCDGGGHCVAGNPVALDDGNPCTDDSCDASTGVVHVAKADGTSCDDPNVCNDHSTCSAGACSSSGTTSTGRVDCTGPASLSVHLPRGLAFSSVAVHAEGAAVTLGTSSTVRGSSGGYGNLTSVGNTGTTLAAGARAGSILSVPSISLAGNAQVFGVAHSEGDIQLGTGALIEGHQGPHQQLGPFSEARLDFVYPTTSEPDHVTNLLFPFNPLADVAYGKVVVTPLSSMFLTGGEYHFNALTVDILGHVLIDNSNGPVLVFIHGPFTNTGNITVQDPSLGNVLFAVTGTQGVLLAGHFQGVIFAPNAPVQLSPLGGKYTGAFFGSSVNLLPGTQISQQPYLRDDCATADDGCGKVLGCPATKVCTPPGDLAAVKPVAECVYDRADGTHLGRFGYENSKTTVVTIVHGTDNHLDPTTTPTFQPTTFGPGTSKRVFYATFSDHVSWSIGSQTATLDLSSPKCDDMVERIDAPVVVRATRDNDSGTSTPGTGTFGSPLPFTVPPRLKVKIGGAGNGTAHFKFQNSGGTLVDCTYKGRSTVAAAMRDLDRALGRFYYFVSCSDGTASGASVLGTSWTIDIQSGDPTYSDTEVEANIGPGCSELEAPISADVSIQTREAFSWANTSELPLTDSDGLPALYYAWIYVESKAQIDALRRMRIFTSTMPLFTSDLQKYMGKCGVLDYSGDGTGIFVHAILPAAVFNQWRQIALVVGQNGKGTIPFRAVVFPTVPEAAALNPDGTLSWYALKAAGVKPILDPPTDGSAFHIGIPIVDDVIELGEDAANATVNFIAGIPVVGGVVGGLVDLGGVVVNTAISIAPTLDDIISVTADIVEGAWEVATTVIGDIDKFFSGTREVYLDVEVLNRDPGFDRNGHLLRAWGPQPASGGVEVSAQQLPVIIKKWVGEIMPAQFNGTTDLDGTVHITVGKGGSTRGSGVCMELENSSVQMISGYTENEFCDFRMDDPTFGDFEHDVPSQPSSGPPNFLQLRVDDWQVQDLSTMTDASVWASEVLQYQTPQVEVGTGFVADMVGAINDHKAFTPCFDFQGTEAIPALLSTAFGEAVGTGGLGLVAFPLLTRDVFLPYSGDRDQGDLDHANSRGVAVHEYGHFLMCSFLHDLTPDAVPALLSDRIPEGKANSSDDFLSILMESFADEIASQVVSGTNYAKWLDTTSLSSEKMKYCTPLLDASGVLQPADCIEHNYRGLSSELPPQDDDTGKAEFKMAVRRYVTLFQDVYDRPDDIWRTTYGVPSNADFWMPTAAGGTQLMPSPTGHQIDHDDNVSLPGFTVQSWLDNSLPGCSGPSPGTSCDLDPSKWERGLGKTLQGQCVTWCDACNVFYNHDPNFADTSSVVGKWTACIQDFSMWSALQDYVSGAYPCSQGGTDPFHPTNQNMSGTDLRIDGASCIECAAGQISQNGQCQACPPLTVQSGNTCVPCPADFIQSGNTCIQCPKGQIKVNNACVACQPWENEMEGQDICQTCNIDASLSCSEVSCKGEFQFSSSAAGDNCPDKFRVHVSHLDQMPAASCPEGMSVTTGISGGPTTDPACSQTSAELALYVGNFTPHGDITIPGHLGIPVNGAPPPCVYDTGSLGLLCSEVSTTVQDADIIVPSPSQQVRLFFGGDDTLVR